MLGAKRQGMLLEVRSVECLIEYDDQSNQLHVKVRAMYIVPYFLLFVVMLTM